jgi:hypothetical protein
MQPGLSCVRSRTALIAAVCGLGISGCSSRPARLTPPAISPATMAAALIQPGDSDGDGMLAGDELTAVPVLASLLGQFDADGDGRLAKAELETWLETIRDSRVAVTSFTAIVRQGGTPLSGAQFTIDPLPPFAATIKAAEGLTDDRGRTSPAIPGAAYPGVNCGIYTVRIEGSAANGRPLPAKYNTESTLGIAVGAGLPPDGAAVFELD